MKLPNEAAVEYRFSLIVRLSKEGKNQREIASLSQCSQGWVSQVLKRYRLLGPSGLKVKGKAPGNASRLDKAQFESFKAFLLEGALAHGFETDNWSRERMAKLIADKFGVQYHVSHMSKLVRQIGFTLQKPKTKSYRKDEQAVKEWKEAGLPSLKKSG